MKTSEVIALIVCTAVMLLILYLGIMDQCWRTS